MTHHLNIWTLEHLYGIRFCVLEIHFMYRLHSHEIFKWMWMLFALTFRFFPLDVRCVCVCVTCACSLTMCENTLPMKWFYRTLYMHASGCVYVLNFIAIWIFRNLLCSFHCRNAEIFVNGGKNCRYRNFAIIFLCYHSISHDLHSENWNSVSSQNVHWQFNCLICKHNISRGNRIILTNWCINSRRWKSIFKENKRINTVSDLCTIDKV